MPDDAIRDEDTTSQSTHNATGASRLQLPPGSWPTLLDGLCARFPAIGRDAWRDRCARGRVLGPHGEALAADARYRAGTEIRYFREVTDEPTVAGVETLLHVDAHLVVVDKPHFLAVMPAGAFVEHTLLARLQRRLGNADLVPLHRLDRETAGLVMFSASRDTRAAYHALFAGRAIDKRYQAIASPLPDAVFPLTRRSHLARGEPFFRMREVSDAEPNAVTCIDVLERGALQWRYALQPVTGRKHQLRVHMASIGAPIANDRWYPALRAAGPDDAARPLQLLASSLSFVDPLDGTLRRFDSGLRLDALD